MTLSSPVLVTASSSTADSATYNTASVANAADSLVLVLVSSGKAANLSEVPTSVTHPTIGALELVATVATGNNNCTLSLWRGVGSGTNGAFTITHANAMDNCAWQVIRFTSDVATPTVEQVDTAQASAAGTLGATLSPAPAAGGCVIGAFTYNNNSDTVSVEGTLTALGTKLTSSSPTMSMWSAYDMTAPLDSTPTFTFAASATKGFMAIEVRDGVAAPTGPSFTMWNGSAEIPVTVTLWDGSAEVPLTAELST